MNFTGSRKMSRGRQEGSSVQHDSVASVGSNFESLTSSSLFQAYLSISQFEIKNVPGIVNSILCVL